MEDGLIGCESIKVISAEYHCKCMSHLGALEKLASKGAFTATDPILGFVEAKS